MRQKHKYYKIKTKIIYKCLKKFTKIFKRCIVGSARGLPIDCYIYFITLVGLIRRYVNDSFVSITLTITLLFELFVLVYLA